mgnify:CR=1 FL=1
MTKKHLYSALITLLAIFALSVIICFIDINTGSASSPSNYITQLRESLNVHHHQIQYISEMKLLIISKKFLKLFQAYPLQKAFNSLTSAKILEELTIFLTELEVPTTKIN